MRERTLIIKRFALGPLAQWGFVAGALVACLPAFLCSWVFFTLVQSMRGLIAGWRDVGFDILGQRVSFNLVELLKLQNVLDSLTGISGYGVFGIVLMWLLLAGLLGIFAAIVLLLVGTFYNLTGRLQLDVEELQSDAPLA